jgi:hypothetical protein
MRSRLVVSVSYSARSSGCPTVAVAVGREQFREPPPPPTSRLTLIMNWKTEACKCTVHNAPLFRPIENSLSLSNTKGSRRWAAARAPQSLPSAVEIHSRTFQLARCHTSLFCRRRSRSTPNLIIWRARERPRARPDARLGASRAEPSCRTGATGATSRRLARSSRGARPARFRQSPSGSRSRLPESTSSSRARPTAVLFPSRVAAASRFPRFVFAPASDSRISLGTLAPTALREGLRALVDSAAVVVVLFSPPQMDRRLTNCGTGRAGAGVPCAAPVGAALACEGPARRPACGPQAALEP